MKLNIIIQQDKKHNEHYILKIQNRKYKINFIRRIDKHMTINLNLPEPTAITPKHKITFNDVSDFLKMIGNSMYTVIIVNDFIHYIINEIPKWMENVK